MSFSILSSVSTGPFFIYLLYLFIHLFSPQNDDIFYVIRNSIFYLLKYLWNLIELESNLNNWAKCYWDLSLKKKMHCFEGKEVIFFSKTTVPCHRTSLNFILSMFSRKIYSKFYVVFTTYKNAKIIKKKLLERYSVKKYF